MTQANGQCDQCDAKLGEDSIGVSPTHFALVRESLPKLLLAEVHARLKKYRFCSVECEVAAEAYSRMSPPRRKRS